MPLFERAQTQLGQSLSSLFGQFLRDRIANLTPDERRVVELIQDISEKREAVKREGDMPNYIESEYAEAARQAEKALGSLLASEQRGAIASFYAANTHYEWAERDVKQLRELGEKIAKLRGPCDGSDIA